jgi:hypothetical protein
VYDGNKQRTCPTMCESDLISYIVNRSVQEFHSLRDLRSCLLKVVISL